MTYQTALGKGITMPRGTRKLSVRRKARIVPSQEERSVSPQEFNQDVFLEEVLRNVDLQQKGFEAYRRLSLLEDEDTKLARRQEKLRKNIQELSEQLEDTTKLKHISPSIKPDRHKSDDT